MNPLLFKKSIVFPKALLFLFFSIIAITESNAQGCTINAGVGQTVCVNDIIQLSGNSPDTYASGPVWEQISGPTVSISDPNIDDPIISGTIGGNTYGFRFSAECFNGDTPFQDILITVLPITEATVGADVASCPDDTGGLIITANTPTNPGETGQWSIVGSNNAGVNIDFPDQPTSTITLPQDVAGTSTLRWTITGPVDPDTGVFCESFAELTVTNFGGEELVSAGSVQNLDNCYTVNQSTNMDASFGGNNINGQVGTWTFVSGPSTPTISDPNDNNTAISNLIEGTYIFRWDVAGPCVSGTDIVTINVDEATQDITQAVVQNNDQRFCDATIAQTTLIGNTPDFAGETVLWEQISGPAATIVDPTNTTTLVTGLSVPNSYQFRYTITNDVTGCDSSAIINAN